MVKALRCESCMGIEGVVEGEDEEEEEADARPTRPHRAGSG